MSTMVEQTAEAMVRVLERHGKGKAMLAEAFHAAVEQDGGYSRHIPDAAKFLRDAGVLIAAQKARHLSTWSLASSPGEVAKWEQRVRWDHFSEMQSQARALAKAMSPTIRMARNRIIANMVAVGVDLGYSAREVIEMCEPVVREQVG